jgi:hypothetical protein
MATRTAFLPPPGAEARGASAGRLARPMSRLGRVRRFSVRLDPETTLQLRGATVHNARTDDRMTLELDGQSFQEGVALSRVDRRGGGLNGVVFVIGEAERHRASLEAARRDRIG